MHYTFLVGIGILSRRQETSHRGVAPLSAAVASTIRIAESRNTNQPCPAISPDSDDTSDHRNVVIALAAHNKARMATRPPNRIMEGMPSQHARALHIGCMALLGISIALVYWPGLRGFWVRDDFFVLAYMR